MAWFDRDDFQTQHVAMFAPNRWGLYDMLGNVAEWVTRENNTSLIAGGSFEDAADDIHSAMREAFTKEWIGIDLATPPPKCWYPSCPRAGFRIVREE